MLRTMPRGASASRADDVETSAFERASPDVALESAAGST
jgi:hypothetical protein